MKKIENKLSYEQFSIELTRRCNMNCKHCSRGDAQDIDMSDDILYSSLENLHTVDEYLNNTSENFYEKGFTNFLFLYGGEPFLCPDTIHKIVDYVLNNNIMLFGFWTITNGTVLSDSIGKDFQRIIPHIKKCQNLVLKKDREQFRENIDELFQYQSIIKVSSNYHNRKQSDKAIDFYSKYDGLEVSYFDDDLSEEERVLSYSGRAKSLTDHKSLWFSMRENHCMATNRFENLAEKTLTIAANGNVFLGLDYEHTYIDDSNLGNVLDRSVYDMAVDWNYKNPLTLYENNKMLEAKSYVFNYENGYTGNYKDMSEEEYKRNQERIKVYERLIEIRKNFHKMYKYLPIERLLFFSDMFLEMEMDGAYIKNYCEESTQTEWNYETDKMLIMFSVSTMPSTNEKVFFERYIYLKPLQGKFPLVDMEVEDCERLYKALERYKSHTSDSLKVLKELQIKYALMGIDITFDDDIEQEIMNSSSLWRIGKAVMKLLNS